MSKFDKFIKKASQQVSSNLRGLEGRLDEFKTSVRDMDIQGRLQGLSATGGDWSAEDMIPQNFPVDVPSRIDIEGKQIKPIKLLDEGGFSFVFVARDLESGQDYALKRLLIQEEEMLTSAMNEIRVMDMLNGHENVIKLVGHKQINKGNQTELYILMELAQGKYIYTHVQ
jgi:hypothetical protein